MASWEPRKVIPEHFPSLLEDKEALIGEGVDTDTTTSPTRDATRVEETAESPESEDSEEDVSMEEGDVGKEPGRPSRQRRPPAWFKDYVSH